MVDMHIHTLYSDGDKTVEEILKMCEEEKLEYISITDHDSVKQYFDDGLNNTVYSGTIIRGTELHAVFQNKKIEVLAYNIDIKTIDKWLENYYSVEKLVQNQIIIHNKLLDIFDKQGIFYEEDKIEKPKKPTDYVERAIYNKAMKHTENHKKLGEFAESFSIFFRKGLTNPDSVFFIEPIGIPNYKEVIYIIHKAGGKAFLAHPFEYGFTNTISFIDNLRNEVELDGIECFHPSTNSEGSAFLVQYAKNNNLYISGGSDFHGKVKPDIKIGVGRGNMHIPKEYIEKWVNLN